MTSPRNGRDGERGSGIAPFLAALMVPVLIASVLLYEGGRRRGALTEARSVASEAARAGSQQIDIDTFTATGYPALLPDEAVAAAQVVLAATGSGGFAVVEGEFITVTATVTHDGFTATASAQAEAVDGIATREG